MMVFCIWTRFNSAHTFFRKTYNFTLAVYLDNLKVNNQSDIDRRKGLWVGYREKCSLNSPLVEEGLKSKKLLTIIGNL